jgi:hypothetical protein
MNKQHSSIESSSLLKDVSPQKSRLLLGVRLVVLLTLPETPAYPLVILNGALLSRIHL